jgi:hypothetical protein
MVRSHALRAMRLPLLLLAVLALIWVGLMSVERASSHPTSLKSTNVSSDSHTNGGPKDKDGDGDNGDKNEHCEDGHGHDAEHNKHCRNISDD